MALALKEQFQIQIVPAYQAADGKRFHDAAEAQGYTRNAMLDSVITAATKERPEFAKLDPVLLRDFLLRTGKHVGAIMNEPLTPVDPEAVRQEKLRTTTEVKITAEALTPEAEASIRAAVARDRPMAHLERSNFGKHPLDGNGLKSAMAAVDDGEMERQVEDDIAAALRLGGH